MLLGRAELKQITEFFELYDADGNNVLSPREIRMGAEATLDARDGGRARASWYLMAFDVNSDGLATPEELVRFVEIRAGRPLAEVTAPDGRTFGGAANDCTLPAITASAQPVFIQGYEGAALSTISVAGRDAVTTVARLEVEPGDGRLYIYATATTHVLWVVAGATERVEHFVLAVGDRGAGVVGLPRDSVTLWDEALCPYSWGQSARQTAVLHARFATAQTRLDAYTIGNMKVPSGADDAMSAAPPGVILNLNGDRFRMGRNGLTPMDQFPNDRHGRTREDLYRFHPLGITSVDPEEVIAPGRVQAYDVLPQEAGLLQLLDAGHLTRQADGAYTIKAPIARFPAGLNGAHSVDFLLMPGVPMPGGHPGHSSLRRMDTGECVFGQCR
ncbi:MAG: hypothetical protein AAFN59_11285 [Pseudomonadota bacterium]